jgi:hypothetical protein
LWSTYSGSAWTQNAINKYTSANKSDNSASWLRLTISAPANCTVTVRITASSESNYDFGYMSSLDGSASTASYVYRVSGTSSQSYVYSVPAGNHYIYFGYTKDGNTSSNNDCVTVEVLSVQGGTTTTGITFGNNIPVSGTLAPLTGAGVSPAGSDFTIMAYSDAACSTAISIVPATVGTDWTWTVWVPAQPSQTAYFKAASSTWSLAPGGVSEAVTLGPEVKTGVSVPAPVFSDLAGTVSISGNAIVTHTLTALTGSLGGTGVLSYQWIREETDIAGATGETYTLVTADQGSTIKVRVSRAGYSGSITSSPTAAVNPVGTAKVIYAWVNAHEIAVSATNATLSRSANQSLTITVTITVTGSGYSNYQWTFYGTDVPGAAGTASSYTFSSAGQVNGKYYIGLRLKKDNVWYSTQITITVTN